MDLKVINGDEPFQGMADKFSKAVVSGRVEELAALYKELPKSFFSSVKHVESVLTEAILHCHELCLDWMMFADERFQVNKWVVGNAFRKACRQNNVAALKFILRSDKLRKHLNTSAVVSGFATACINNYVEAAKLCLEGDAFLEADGAIPKPHPLVEAVAAGSSAVAEMVLKEMKTTGPNTEMNLRRALVSAVDSGHIDCIEALLKHPDSESIVELAMVTAIEHGNANIIQCIFDLFGSKMGDDDFLYMIRLCVDTNRHHLLKITLDARRKCEFKSCFYTAIYEHALKAMSPESIRILILDGQILLPDIYASFVFKLALTENRSGSIQCLLTLMESRRIMESGSALRLLREARSQFYEPFYTKEEVALKIVSANALKSLRTSHYNSSASLLERKESKSNTRHSGTKRLCSQATELPPNKMIKSDEFSNDDKMKAADDIATNYLLLVSDVASEEGDIPIDISTGLLADYIVGCTLP